MKALDWVMVACILFGLTSALADRNWLAASWAGNAGLWFFNAWRARRDYESLRDRTLELL